MRDLILTLILFASLPLTIKRPWIGALMWVWVSVMSPHRLSWGFAYNVPWAQLIAIATLLGIFFSKDPKRLPLTPAMVVLGLMTLWMNVSMLFAVHFDLSVPMWTRVMKIIFMTFVVASVLHTRRHIELLVWVCAVSIAFYGVKGGIFTLVGGGQDLVWGPEGSFIEGNNPLALAVVMTIPLLRFLQLQASRHWIRWGLLAAMGLCFVSALGSHSRGALLAIATMLGMLWLKGRNKMATGLVMVMLVPVAIGFMPQKWGDRMKTIETYEEDDSALGRINAWTMAWNLAKDRPLWGGGFEVYMPDMFARYAPKAWDLHSAHSIYFQMLGEHGFVGLGLYLLLWLLVWRDAAWIARNAQNREGWQWAGELARMIQVSLAGFAVGGTFLNLAYYDVPYYLLVAMVLTRLLLEKEMRGNPSQNGWFSRPAAPVDKDATAAAAAGRSGLRPSLPVRRVHAGPGAGRR